MKTAIKSHLNTILNTDMYNVWLTNSQSVKVLECVSCCTFITFRYRCISKLHVHVRKGNKHLIPYKLPFPEMCASLIILQKNTKHLAPWMHNFPPL